MSAHTKGPWRLFVGEQGAFVIEDENNIAVLCQRADWPHRAEESKANGRLIAAAPDLLDALKVAQKLAASGPAPLPPSDPRWAQIADAIEKAEGALKDSAVRT